jgi:hypothetical protein
LAHRSEEQALLVGRDGTLIGKWQGIMNEPDIVEVSVGSAAPDGINDDVAGDGEEPSGNGASAVTVDPCQCFGEGLARCVGGRFPIL